jgi:hypothetical protein
MTIFKIEISANAVAWYGAIVATASVLISLLNFLRDRPKIQLKIFEGLLVYGNNLGDNTQIFIEAINVGRRSVTLSGAGLTLKNGKQITIIKSEIVNFPYELQEGKSVQVWINKNDAFRDAGEEKTKITYAWYRDATGKIYKTKFYIKDN